ncbi:hypothetical protein WN944_025898 [Citrus x changshan-huyou]|uniref:Uncharacterized protein n=1 Tax=Citrus x changshan-huyou TaxID=2935761 RepID=A0AAP0QH46_9ROSI
MANDTTFHKDVAVPAKSLDTKRAAGSSAIYFKFVTNLKGLINEKACKGHGYFLSVTNLKRIGKEGSSVNGQALCTSVSIYVSHFLARQGRSLAWSFLCNI